MNRGGYIKINLKNSLNYEYYMSTELRGQYEAY